MGTGLCVHNPIHRICLASLARLANPAPCPPNRKNNQHSQYSSGVDCHNLDLHTLSKSTRLFKESVSNLRVFLQKACQIRHDFCKKTYQKHVNFKDAFKRPSQPFDIMDGPYLRLSARTTYHSAAVEILFRLRHKASAVS